MLYCIILLTVASRSQRVSLIVIPFCLSVWMSVGHSATYSLPRLIDHNQIWSAGIYLSSDPCKPFCIPYLSYFRYQRENMQNFAYFQRQPFNTYSCYCEGDASCHMTCFNYCRRLTLFIVLFELFAAKVLASIIVLRFPHVHVSNLIVRFHVDNSVHFTRCYCVHR